MKTFLSYILIVVFVTGCVMLYIDSPQTNEHNTVNTANKGLKVDDEREIYMETDSG